MVTTLSGGASPFAAMAGNWSTLLNFFQHYSRLPHDPQAFAARYGSFDDAQGVTQLTSAFADIADTARRLGGPDSLKRNISDKPDYLFRAEPPDELYAHNVWLASQVQNAASGIAETLSSLPSDLPSVSEIQRGRMTQTLLSGQGSVAQTAEDLQRKTQDLASRFEPLRQRLSNAAQVFGATNVLNEANVALGRMEGAVGRLQSQAAAAYKKWTGRDLPPGGAPPPASGGDEAGGGWSLFGGGREKAHKEYEQLAQELAARQAELQQKSQLAEDLDSNFFVGARALVPAVQNIEGALGQLGRVFGSTAERLRTASDVSSQRQLSDPDWLTRALDLPASVEAWRALAADAQQFAQRSMISPAG